MNVFKHQEPSISIDIGVMGVQKQVSFSAHNILRYPRLDTVLMIEKAIQKAKGDLTVTQLWKKLPKKVMWQTYLTTLDYLEYSGKIYVGKDRHVVWIWGPERIEELKRKGLIAR